MKAKLLSLITLLLFAVGAKAQVKPTPKFSAMVADGKTVQYIYNVETGAFILGANEWNTRASVSAEKGYKFMVEPNGETYKLKNYVETQNAWKYMFAEGASSIFVDRGSQANWDNWVITAKGNTYEISNRGYAGKLGVNDIASDNRTHLSETVKNATWAFVSEDDYAQYAKEFQAYLAEVYGKQRLEAANGFMGGDVLILNAETGLYVGGANDWGTKASALKHADFMTVNRLSDGLYTIDSHVSNGGANHFLGTNGYVDSPAANYTITYDKAAKAYTIAAPDGKLLNNANDNRVNFDGTKVDGSTLWRFVSKADMLEQMKSAALDNPVDITALLPDANFGRNNQNWTAWIVGGNCTNRNLSGGNNSNNNAESFHSTFNIYQTLFDMPKGTYMVKVQGFFRQDGQNTAVPVFYANESKRAFPSIDSEGLNPRPNSMSDASVQFSKGLYNVTLPLVTVDDNGVLEIGVKNESNKELWCIWDNFEVYYMGPNEVSNNPFTVEVADNNGNVIAEGATIDPDKTTTLYMRALPNALANIAKDYSKFDMKASLIGADGIVRTFSGKDIDKNVGLPVNIKDLAPTEYTNYKVEITEIVFGGEVYPLVQDVKDYAALGQAPIATTFDFAIKTPDVINYEVSASFVEAQKQLNITFYSYGAEFDYVLDAQGNRVQKEMGKDKDGYTIYEDVMKMREPRQVLSVLLTNKGVIKIDGQEIDLEDATYNKNVVSIDLSKYIIEDGEHTLTFEANTLRTYDKSSNVTYRLPFETTFDCSGLTEPVIEEPSEFEGKRFSIAPGGGCDLPIPADAVRTFTFTGQWSSVAPSKNSFNSSEYSNIYVEFATPLEFNFNTPHKDANGGQQWHTGSGMWAGNTEWTVDVAQLGVINDLSIQNVQPGGTTASFTIKQAYAEKVDGTKETLVFNAPGWGGSMSVKGVYSGLAKLTSQWGGVNVSDDIIGLEGKKILRIYSNSNLNDVNIQWCCKSVDGKDFWPQIGIVNDNYAECVIEETLQSIYLQHTVGDAQSIDIKALTWELYKEPTTDFEVALVNGEENYTLNTHASVSVEKIDGLTVKFPEANVASASYDIVPLYYVENAEGGEWVPAMPQAIVGDFTIAKNVASASLNSTATLMQGTKYQVDVFVTFKNGQEGKQTYTVDGATVDDTKSAAEVLGNPEIAMDADKLTITFAGAGIAEIEGASLASAGISIESAGVLYFGNADEVYAENGKIVLSLNLAATMNMADFSPYTYKAGDDLTITIMEPDVYANHADGSYDKVATGDDIVAKYTTTAAAGLDLDGKMFVITDATGKTTFGVTHESGVRPGGEQDVFSVSNDVYSDDMHVYAKFAKVEKAGVEGNIYTIQLCKADGTNYSLWGSNGYLNFQPTGQNIVFALGLGDGEKYGQDAENCGLWDVQEVDGGVTIKNVGNGGYLNPCAASDASIAIAPSAEAVVCKLAKSFSKDGAEFVKDNTTAIAGIDAEANKVIFNLNGVRMNKTVNGINIINGKKVFIKK